jgi:death-on-curing protein
MRYLSLPEVFHLHQLVLEQTGGSPGLRDLGRLESAVAQPRMTFGGEDLYPTVQAKAAALCFSLVSNHPFIDGNKRVAHAAMETFLVLNGWELTASVNQAEHTMLRLASGSLSRDELVDWVRNNVRQR